MSTHLDLRPKATIAELTRDAQAMDEPSLIKTYMEHKEPGLDVLCAPLSPENGSLVTAGHVARLAAGLRSTYDLVIIDAASTLDDRTQAAFEAADVVVFTAPEIAALKALHTLLETLSETGAAVGKTVFVLNHVFGREMLKLQDIENSLAAKITLEIPHEPVLYLKAVNEGIPVVRGAPKSAPAERLNRLATLLAGSTDKAPGGASTEPAKSRGLGGILSGVDDGREGPGMTPMPSGWIHVIAGCMFSGKTDELLRLLRRAEIAGRRVILIRPTIDDRTSPEVVESRSGVPTDRDR